MRVLGRGEANLTDKKTNATNVWHVEGLKKNILSRR